jgi:hypothetical protein
MVSGLPRWVHISETELSIAHAVNFLCWITKSITVARHFCILVMMQITAAAFRIIYSTTDALCLFTTSTLTRVYHPIHPRRKKLKNKPSGWFLFFPSKKSLSGRNSESAVQQLLQPHPQY